MVLAKPKLRVLFKKHTFLEIIPAYPIKSSNLLNFREGRQKVKGRQQGEGGGGGVFGGGGGGGQHATLRHCCKGWLFYRKIKIETIQNNPK